MSGFPLRAGRDDFGPTMQDTAPVRDATRQLDADRVNLLMWQTAGAGITAPLAWAVVFLSATPASLVVQAHAEAWNPHGLSSDPYYTPPVLSRFGLGEYRIDWPATVLDRNGDEVELGIVGGFAAPVGLHNVHVSVTPDGSIVGRRLLRVRTADGASGADEVGLFVAIY